MFTTSCFVQFQKSRDIVYVRQKDTPPVIWRHLSEIYVFNQTNLTINITFYKKYMKYK